MSIIYKELLIVDFREKIARKIHFKNGINIVTSNVNSVGKSSLSLMLLYSFGAKVKFSDKWNLDNIFTKLTLIKDENEIIIIRYKDSCTIKTTSGVFPYSFITKGYADKLYELLGLSIKIKDKNSNTYTTAVPSLYLLPYFLSQTNTDNDRSIFEDLAMYSKKDLYDALYYHVGALDNEYTSIIQQLTCAKTAIEQLKNDKQQQIYEINYLTNKLNENKNGKAIDNNTDIENDINIYKKFACQNQEYYTLLKEVADIKHKIQLLTKSLNDNSRFAERLLKEEDIRCPVCKSDITDFVSAAIKLSLADEEINSEIVELKANQLKVERKMASLSPKLEILKNQIAQIESIRNNVNITRAIIVWNEELNAAQTKFAKTQLEIEKLENRIKDYNTKLNNYSDKRSIADNSYRNAFSDLLDSVNIDKHGIDISNLNLYHSFALGGSEIPRIAIARFFALLESKNKESIVMPIIFDFPNLDMTEENITKCFALMCDKIINTSIYPQSMVFSIDCLERIEKAGRRIPDCNIINMDSLPVDDKKHPRLLCKRDYLDNLNEIIELLNR